MVAQIPKPVEDPVVEWEPISVRHKTYQRVSLQEVEKGCWRLYLDSKYILDRLSQSFIPVSNLQRGAIRESSTFLSQESARAYFAQWIRKSEHKEEVR